MAVFPKPQFEYTYNLADERGHLDAHKQKRAIPVKQPGTVLVATWNIANFGAQHRRSEDRALIAHILEWFDIVAVQESRENFGDLADVQEKLGDDFGLLFSDSAGNDERLAFVYDRRKLEVLEEVGEIAFPPSELDDIKLEGVKGTFLGFDRNPYFASFKVRDAPFSFTLVNVHLFYGSEAKEHVDRRCLETYAVAKWAASRQKSRYSYARELLALGDFNMPKKDPADPVFKTLTKLGLVLPEHSSEIAATVSSDAQYDQVAFFPRTSKDHFTGLQGIFDFDAAVFPDLWANGTRKKDFNAYLRYYLSDHRPMWVQIRA